MDSESEAESEEEEKGGEQEVEGGDEQGGATGLTPLIKNFWAPVLRENRDAVGCRWQHQKHSPSFNRHAAQEQERRLGEMRGP